MNLTSYAIERNRVTAVFLILLLFIGITSFAKMPRDEDPGFIVRTALVITHFPGASPDRVEMLVTEKIEEAIQEMPEVDVIKSESKTGVSIVTVDIKESHTHMRPIWDSLRRKVEDAASKLPKGVMKSIVNDEFGDVFGTIVTITGDGFNYAQLKDVADEVRDELLLISEVAKVEIVGVQDERIFIEYNNAKLAELGISSYQLKNILETQNIIISGGSLITKDEKIALEPTGNFESVEALKKSIIKLPSRKELLYLEDIATVSRGYIDPPKSLVHSSVQNALAIAVNMRKGGNIILLGQQVREKIRALQNEYPIGIDFDFVAFQPEHVDKKVTEFVSNLYQAIAIVMIVMLFTLGFRTGLIVASLIPMSMLMAISVMSFFDIGIDQMSLASLIIALGMLVDNAIVMSESVMVQMEKGKSAKDAAIDSAKELQVPLLTSSLTTAAAFLPIFLAESSTGEYTAPLFKVVTITLLCSWILSLTMIPLLCVYFMKVKSADGSNTFNSVFYRTYKWFLLKVVRWRVISLLAIIGVFFIALQGFKYVPKIFFPPDDKAIFTIEIELPIGSPIEKTTRVVSKLEKYMKEMLMVSPKDKERGIVNWSVYIGKGAPRFYLSYSPEQASPQYAIFIVNTSDNKIIGDLISKIEGYISEQFPDAVAKVSPLARGTPADAPVEVRVSGKDADTVFDIADTVKERLAKIKGVKNIRDDWGARTKKLVIKIDQTKAQRAGVSSEDIAVSLQTELTGMEVTQYREGKYAIPVTLRSMSAGRQDLAKLETINIYSQSTGKNVSLKQVADMEIVWQPAKILRRNRLKTVTVQTDNSKSKTSIEISNEIEQWLKEEKKKWQVGYTYSLGGEVENSKKANVSIGAKLPVAGLIIVLLLVGQFNSIRRPLIILLTIPLSLIGVIAGLLIAKSVFGFMTLLGIISLAGIVINNAIVLLDRIKIEIEENGLEPSKAIIESAQQRLRPILLTTATTVFGLIPLWLGGGDMWKPMAVSIIFGLMVATILTLGVVPLLYSIFFKVSFKNYKLND